MYQKTVSYMKHLVETKKIPGISYAFVNQNNVVEGRMGVKQIKPTVEALTENTLYDMASLTKIICTTTLILKLTEDEQIDLEKPVAHYLSDMIDQKVTIKELLTHTSDINGYIPNRNQLNQNQLREAILRLTSGENRGKIVKYTDTGTILLGFLIEEIYQKKLHHIFKEEILIPLEMKDSGFSHLNIEQVAPTELSTSRGLIKGDVHDPKAFVLKEHCGSAGLFATLSDTLHFVQMILNKGVYKNNIFLKEETINNLPKNHAELADKSWSLGWNIIPYDHRQLLFHTGYTGTFMVLDIEQKEAFVFLSNRVHPYDKREDYLMLRDELIRTYLGERQAVK